METNYSDKVTAFDAIFTNNHIQMLKILLPCLHPSVQKQLAVYIKLSELRYTLLFFQQNPYARLPRPLCGADIRSDWGYVSENGGAGDGYVSENAEGSGVEDGMGAAADLCRELLPLCSPAEKEKVQNFINMCQNLQNMQEIMQIIEMIQELSPDMPQGADGMNGLDIAQTLEMLQGFWANGQNVTETGGIENDGS